MNLKDQVDYQPGQVVSKTLVQNEYVSMTIFSFDKGEEISTRAAGGYADGSTKSQLKAEGIDIYDVLKDNDAYHALEKTG